jgi:hypothetical protein
MHPALQNAGKWYNYSLSFPKVFCALLAVWGTPPFRRDRISPYLPEGEEKEKGLGSVATDFDLSQTIPEISGKTIGAQRVVRKKGRG